jgi:toluene monooxygenase electron transfer component
MKIIANARNQSHMFDAEAGEKILDAGLRSGLTLPYECGSGTCGTCRARLVSGELTDAWPEAPGRRLLKAERTELLMCQNVARTDCVVEVPFGKVEPMADGACVPGRLAGVVRGVTPLTHDVVRFDLELDRPLRFEAGQFVLMGVEGLAGRRAYSMVNYDRPSPRLRLVVKKKPGGGVSEWLFGGSVEGARVSLFGPMGAAIFTPEVDQPLLCMAGGSGIAGLMSILARASAEGHFARHPGHVFFGVRTAADLFFADELAAFKARAPERLEIVVALSEGEVDDGLRARHPAFTFDTGFVHEVTLRRMADKFAGVRAYLAGPPPMVDASIRMLLKEARLGASDIRYDKFS